MDGRILVMNIEQQAKLGRAYSEREHCRDSLDAAIRLERADPSKENYNRLMREQRRYCEAAITYEITEVSCGY